MMDAVPPLFGLLLAGGRSTRMRRDKAALQYHGRTQLEAAYDLLAKVTVQAYVSVRADQTADPLRSRYPQIVDRDDHMGPLAGILAAQQRHPEAAWLVLACDLPLLDEATLRHLDKHRDRAGLATAYRSSHDGLPEPLCTVYEPASALPLARYAAAGRNCPRKFLLEQSAKLLEPLHAAALGATAAASLTLRVQYFALLREQAGCSDESLVTAARTPAELYTELQAKYGFSLPLEMLKVAVNAEFGDWHQPLQDGDAVVFIPPVAGG